MELNLIIIPCAAMRYDGIHNARDNNYYYYYYYVKSITHLSFNKPIALCMYVYVFVTQYKHYIATGVNVNASNNSLVQLDCVFSVVFVVILFCLHCHAEIMLIHDYGLLFQYNVSAVDFWWKTIYIYQWVKLLVLVYVKVFFSYFSKNLKK